LLVCANPVVAPRPQKTKAITKAKLEIREAELLLRRKLFISFSPINN